MCQSTFNGDSNWRHETWIHHFDPENKEKNMVWVASDGERPVIARRNKAVSKIMYANFFDGHGPVL